jgi:hypothetical protein
MKTRPGSMARLRVAAVFLTTTLCVISGLKAIPPVVFRTPPSFPVGDGPAQMVVADFNGDGLLDLATANFDDSTVSILLGQGGGSFCEAVHYPVGAYPDSLAVGDFNCDGVLDLVTANGNGWNQPGTLSVLLGRGDGTFQTATNVTVGRGPRGVAVADFNRDGKLDLATAISGGWFETNQVEVVLGHGDGTFDPPVSYTVQTSPQWIAGGDINHDGWPDLAAANAGPQASGTTVSVLLNRGDGTFQAASNYTVGTYPRFVAVSDVDWDGHPDLLAANGSSLSVLYGRGDGTFNGLAQFAVPAGVSSFVVGDFNQDSLPDVAALGGSYDAGAVTVLLGNGAGAFLPPTAFSIGASLQTVAAGDFNGDNHLDLAVAGTYDNTVLLMEGKGDGTFKNSTDTYPAGAGIQGMITDDFNHDGQIDVVTVNRDANSVSALLQQTNGLFLPAVNYPVGAQPRAVKAGDFNNDGWTDLVVANFDGTLTMLRGRTTAPGVFTNNWNNGFLGTVSLGSNHTDVAVGCFNAGNHLDIVTPNYYNASLTVALGDGTGAFHTPLPPAVPVHNGPTCVVVDDFDGDGKADIAVGYEGGFKISIVTGNGDGTFNPLVDIDTWEIPYYIISADVDGDGKPDLIAAHYDWRRVSVMLNRTPAGGPITFAPPVVHDVANDPVTIAVGDFNGDNRLDIVSGNYASVSVLLGNGDGTFLAATNYFVGGRVCTVGDFNGDGMPDVAIDLSAKVGLFWNDTLPRLQIAKAAGGVRVAWPAWKPYVLEANTNVAASGSWRVVTTTPSQDRNQFVITNAVQGFQQTYRLRRPSL